MKPIYFLYFSLLLAACGAPESETTTTPVSDLDGKALSQIHCASCHLYPEPERLDKATWQNFILLRMAAFMGIYTDGKTYFDQMPPQWIEPGIGGQRVQASNVYPPQPLLSREDWEKIRDYYLANAPTRTAPAETPSIAPALRHFKTHPLLKQGFYEAYTQAVAMDTTKGQILLSLFEQNVIRIDRQGIVQEALGYNRVITDIDLDASGLTLTAMGNRNGLDEPRGQWLRGRSIREIGHKQQTYFLDSLQRPVSSVWTDLNGDGREDVVIAEFGNYLGQLAWYEQTPEGQLLPHILYQKNGTIKVAVADLTEDGLPDIIALMGNGDEGIDLYRNLGQGQFQRERLLRFPSTYGSTDFELVDFDRDGQLDLLYINGDNGDYPPILKSHHGIRLFRNEGQQKFTESFYLPQNGGYQVRSRDFDLDGDLDIVSVAYHPDFRNLPQESFVYWEQTAPGQFKASTFAEVRQGRWMRLEVGDLDRDGDPDILLGAFNAQSQDVPNEQYQAWLEAKIPALWLENTIVR